MTVIHTILKDTCNMQFLLIISHDQAFRPTDQLLLDIQAWIERAEAQNVRMLGKPLRPAGEATTIRVRDGLTQVTAGPFSSSAEQMCAFELVECASEADAVELASAHPMARVATIEVRPVWEGLEAAEPRT